MSNKSEEIIAFSFLDKLNTSSRKGVFTLKKVDTPENRKALGTLPDFELFYNDRLIGAVEVRIRFTFIDKYLYLLKNAIDNAYRHIIITDGRRVIIYDFTSLLDWQIPIYDNEFSSKVISIITIETNIESDTGAVFSIRESIFNSLMRLSDFLKQRSLRVVIPSLVKSEIDSSYIVDSRKKEVGILPVKDETQIRLENILFNLLIEDFEINKDPPFLIYRYGNFDSIFNTVNGTTYRINGIQGMNDQSEGFHILRKIYGDGLEFEQDRSLSERFNEIYISSCSALKDNLTMWRLYGDNSRGICMELELLSSPRQPFFVKKVVYVDKDRKEILRILHNLVREVAGLGYRIRPEVFSLLIFFMKDHRYKIENEIRIVFDKALIRESDSSGFRFNWGIAEPFKIVRPYVDVSYLADEMVLPFLIRRIILGPNCPKENRNKLQFESLIKERGIDIEVVQSKIDRDLYIG